MEDFQWIKDTVMVPPNGTRFIIDNNHETWLHGATIIISHTPNDNIIRFTTLWKRRLYDCEIQLSDAQDRIERGEWLETIKIGGTHMVKKHFSKQWIDRIEKISNG